MTEGWSFRTAVDALQAVIILHPPLPDTSTCGEDDKSWPCPTIRTLAAYISTDPAWKGLRRD